MCPALTLNARGRGVGYIAYVCCTAYELNVKIIAFELNVTNSTRESRNVKMEAPQTRQIRASKCEDVKKLVTNMLEMAFLG